MSIFQEEVKIIEKANNSLIEVVVSLKRMMELIMCRKEASSFISMKVKSRLHQLCNNDINVDKF